MPLSEAMHRVAVRCSNDEMAWKAWLVLHSHLAKAKVPASVIDGSFAAALVEEGLTYFEKQGDAGDKEYVRAIRAHIATLRSGVKVTDGWVLVPREPTAEMMSAARKIARNRFQIQRAWDAMLSAAPAHDAVKE